MPNLAQLPRPNPAARLLLTILVGGVGAVVMGYVITRGGVPTAGLLIAGPPALLFAGWCFRQPRAGLYTCLIFGFFLYSHSIGDIIAPMLPVNTGVLFDGLLGLGLLGALFRANRDDWSRLHNPVTYLLLLWLLYNVFELINPEAVSREPWPFVMRVYALHWFVLTLVGLFCLTNRADLDDFIRLWLIACAVQALWSFKQQYLGLTALEADWLENVGRKTHLLNGQLRSFSLCPDAGQFGAVMAHASLYAFIRMLDEPATRQKLLYGGLGALYFWGFAVAGSRGPIVILAAGFGLYLLLKRNIALLTAGAVVMGLAYGFLRFTNAGQGNYQIQRMRSSLNPEDPSFQIRKYNQQLFAVFMASRPFGVGLGLAGESGTKYWKNVLTERGIDSWYVKIWVETGVVGLTIHGVSLLVFLGLGLRQVLRLRDPRLRSVLTGLVCSYAGLLLANYGNQLLGQKPICFVIYISIVFFAQAHRLESAAKPVSVPSSTPYFPPRV